MPSKSKAQARLMAAAAHTPGGYGGVPQSVGKEFNQADKGTGILRKKKGGSVEAAQSDGQQKTVVNGTARGMGLAKRGGKFRIS